MNERLLKSLYDIKTSIEEIDLFFADRPKQFDQFRKDVLLRRGIERELEIIGEAMNRILKEHPAITITDAHRIVALRNRIIHGYDSIVDDNIWAVVINHLPTLSMEVNALIARMGE